MDNDHIPASALQLPDSITDNLVHSMKEGDVGAALSMWIVALSL